MILYIFFCIKIIYRTFTITIFFKAESHNSIIEHFICTSKVVVKKTRHAVRSDSVRFSWTCTTRADLLSATIISRLKDQTAQINFLSDFYRSIGHVFMGFLFRSAHTFSLQQNTFFYSFLLPGPIPIKNSIDVSIVPTRARKHSHVRKLETESPKNSASHQKTYIVKWKLLWIWGYVLRFFNCNLFLYF